MSSRNQNTKSSRIKKALTYWRNKQDEIFELIRVDLKRIFETATMNQIFSGRMEFTNQVKRLVERLTNIWEDAPEYTLQGTEENGEKDDSFEKKMNENFSRLQYGEKLAGISAKMRLLNRVFVHIVYSVEGIGENKKERVKFVTLTENDAIFTFNPFNEVIEYTFVLGDIQYRWTPEFVYITGGKEKKEKKEKNPYGFLPLADFEFVLSDDDDDPFGEPFNELINTMESINFFLNVDEFQAMFSGFDLVFFYGDHNKTGRMKINPNKMTKIEDPDFKLQTHELKMYHEKYREKIQTKFAILLESIGLPPDAIQISSSMPASGISKLMDSQEFFELIKKYKLLFKPKEQRFLFLLNEIFKARKSTDFHYFELKTPADIEIKYATLKPYITDEEKQKQIHDRVEKGTMSYVDAIMKLYKVDKKEAEEKFNEIVEQRALFLTTEGVTGAEE